MASAAVNPLDVDWMVQRERALAWLRLGFALLAVAVIQLNSGRDARYPELSFYSVKLFLVYSLVAFFYIRKYRRLSTTAAITFTTLDIIWISLIVYSTGGTRTPFSFFFAFPVITASLRWGIKGTIPVALIGVAVYGGMRLTLAAEGITGPVGIDRIVVRSFYLMVLALIFGYVGDFERKQNLKLIALSQTAAQAAVSDERRRIMIELHDSILQCLATLILRLEICRRRLSPAQEEIAQDLRFAEDFSRSTMQDIRRFLNANLTEFMPTGALLDKLRDELKFLRDGLKLDVVMECTPESLSLPQRTERELYLVIREALNNITRHSYATKASIHLHQEGDRLTGVVHDNGVGFEQNGQGSGGLGLTGMAERIKQIGGEIRIKSSPGDGTNISFVVPLTS